MKLQSYLSVLVLVVVASVTAVAGLPIGQTEVAKRMPDTAMLSRMATENQVGEQEVQKRKDEEDDDDDDTDLPSDFSHRVDMEW